MIQPSNFRGDPLGWAGNQAGHMMIAAGVALLFSLAYFAWAKEYPYRVAIAGVVAVVYLMVELPQRGELWDTIEDIMFAIGYGSALFIFPFREIAAGNMNLQFDPRVVVAPSVLLFAHFVIGISARELQRRGIL